MSLIEVIVYAALGSLSMILLIMWVGILFSRLSDKSLDRHVDHALALLRCACDDPNEVTVRHGVTRCVYRGDLTP